MKAVGVKVLKAKLSEYLRLVNTGETVLVTEHDQVIAELRPAHRQRTGPPALEEKLLEWADQGKVTLRASEAMDWPSFKDLPKVEGMSWEEMKKVLDDLRKDSWE
jgi:antitoxin (DNA-binding transcriptional repressor) of toxin-antitoxin stability system